LIDAADIEHDMVRISGGIYDLGFSGDYFCYDNEIPEHKTYLNPYQIDTYPVTNREFIDFIDSGGIKIIDFGYRTDGIWSKKKIGKRHFTGKKSMEIGTRKILEG